MIDDPWKFFIPDPSFDGDMCQSLQILPQSDRNDRKVGAECEHGEKREVVTENRENSFTDGQERKVFCKEIQRVDIQ